MYYYYYYLFLSKIIGKIPNLKKNPLTDKKKKMGTQDFLKR